MNQAQILVAAYQRGEDVPMPVLADAMEESDWTGFEWSGEWYLPPHRNNWLRMAPVSVGVDMEGGFRWTVWDEYSLVVDGRCVTLEEARAVGVQTWLQCLHQDQVKYPVGDEPCPI